MLTKHKPTILLVDDEESILKALKRALAQVGAGFITATSGEAALELLKDESVAIIISDQRMPGMGGVEFLKQSISLAPNATRILLTGYADIDATVDAINTGAVRYYLNKPWDDDNLISRIRDSLDMHHTLIENQRLQALTDEQNRRLESFNHQLQQKVEAQTATILEQNEELKHRFMDTIKAFSTVIGLRLKPVASHSQRTATLAKLLLKGLEIDEKERLDIIVAAYLHDVGRIALPDNLANKPIEFCSSQEKDICYRHPILGQSCVIGIRGFENVAKIIRHHHENFDGTGYPDCLLGEGIPIGARVLRVCDAFDHIALKTDFPDQKTLKAATTSLQRNSGSLFDPELVKTFCSLSIADQFYHDDSSGVIGLRPDALKVGMVLAADIRTISDVFLLPKGARLSAGMIARIKKIHAVDKILDAIRVYKQSTQRENRHEPGQAVIG